MSESPRREVIQELTQRCALWYQDDEDFDEESVKIAPWLAITAIVIFAFLVVASVFFAGFSLYIAGDMSW